MNVQLKEDVEIQGVIHKTGSIFTIDKVVPDLGYGFCFGHGSWYFFQEHQIEILNSSQEP